MPKTAADRKLIRDLTLKPGYTGLHVNAVHGRLLCVMVAYECIKEFLHIIAKIGALIICKVGNVEKMLAEARVLKQSSRRTRSLQLSWYKYYRGKDINNYLDQLAAKYHKTVTVVNKCKSFEKRTMKTIKITKGDGIKKRLIVIDAGIHAREWIAPATALYIIHQLVQKANENEDLLRSFDFLILPLVNPDGYEYSHKSERFWRKTRSNPKSKCPGVDANRNYDYKWGVCGTSKDPCDEIYLGKEPFSEPESRCVRDLLLSAKGVGIFYLSLHSYGPYILYPWGWKS